MSGLNQILWNPFVQFKLSQILNSTILLKNKRYLFAEHIRPDKIRWSRSNCKEHLKNWMNLLYLINKTLREYWLNGGCLGKIEWSKVGHSGKRWPVFNCSYQMHDLTNLVWISYWKSFPSEFYCYLNPLICAYSVWCNQGKLKHPNLDPVTSLGMNASHFSH